LHRLPARAHRQGPWRSLDPLTAQIDNPLQCGLELEADRSAAPLQLQPGDRAITPVVPLLKQPLLQCQQL
jgi:hypothetical protein